MCTVPRCILYSTITVLGVSIAGCDSVSTEQPPAIHGIQSDSEVLMFRPGEPVPAAELSVNAPHEDDVTFRWSASGGSFESTGTSKGAEGRTVIWQPEPLGGTYTIIVRATRGQSSTTDSTSIDVEPRLFGNWQGEIELSNEAYDRAEFCMFVSSEERLSQYSYFESRSSGGTTDGRGSEGSAMQPVGSYDYPEYESPLAEGDSDDFDEPVALTGTISADGTLFQAEIELESGATREFELGRTEFYCQ